MGDTEAGGYMPIPGFGNVIRPGAALEVDWDVLFVDVVPLCWPADGGVPFLGFGAPELFVAVDMSPIVFGGDEGGG